MDMIVTISVFILLFCQRPKNLSIITPKLTPFGPGSSSPNAEISSKYFSKFMRVLSNQLATQTKVGVAFAVCKRMCTRSLKRLIWKFASVPFFLLLCIQVEANDGEFLREKCETLLDSWKRLKPPHQLAKEVAAYLFQSNPDWDGKGEPTFFRHMGKLHIVSESKDQYDQLAKTLQAWHLKGTASVTAAERKIFGIPESVPLEGNKLNFAIKFRAPTSVVLETYNPQRELIGAVILEMAKANLGYVDSIDDSLERFADSIARQNGETVKQHWLTLISSDFRLFLVHEFSELNKVAFAFPVWTDTRTRSYAPRTYGLGRQPLEIFLLRQCQPNRQNQPEIRIIDNQGQWQTWCAVPFGRISRPARSSSWRVTG